MQTSPTAASAVISRERPAQVLHIGKYYPPHMGGIETHLQALARGLKDSVDVRVVVSSDDSRTRREVSDGVPLLRVPTPLTVASTPLSPAMVRQIRNSDADLLHIHLPNPAAVLAYLTSGYHGKVIFTYHSDIIRQKILGPLFEPLLHAALRRADAIVVTSPNYLRTSPVLAEHQERCHVIPYGIDTSDFSTCDAADVRRIREQHGDRIIIAVGRLVYYKGFEYLIRAMKRVDGKLLILGDGPLRPELEQLTSKLGVQDKVVLVGEVQNHLTVPYYHAAQVYALPSIARSEAFGIVQIEAMASGLPVVNTSLDSGVPFVSLHNETGLTVPPRDPDALAAALTSLLDDSELRRRLGAAGIRRAQEEFSVQRMVGRMLDLYETVRSGHRTRAAG
jgi:glycosyltransferase involved in cell wall biosynthesis